MYTCFAFLSNTVCGFTHSRNCRAKWKFSWKFLTAYRELQVNVSDLTLIVAVVQVPRHAFAITCSQVSQAFVRFIHCRHSNSKVIWNCLLNYNQVLSFLVAFSVFDVTMCFHPLSLHCLISSIIMNCLFLDYNKKTGHKRPIQLSPIHDLCLLILLNYFSHFHCSERFVLAQNWIL